MKVSFCRFRTDYKVLENYKILGLKATELSTENMGLQLQDLSNTIKKTNKQVYYKSYSHHSFGKELLGNTQKQNTNQAAEYFINALGNIDCVSTFTTNITKTMKPMDYIKKYKIRKQDQMQGESEGTDQIPAVYMKIIQKSS